jgi:hypothetical protein
MLLLVCYAALGMNQDQDAHLFNFLCSVTSSLIARQTLDKPLQIRGLQYS